MKTNLNAKKKSNYVKPQIEVIHLESEGILAGSLSADSDSLGGNYGRRSYSRGSYRRR